MLIRSLAFKPTCSSKQVIVGSSWPKAFQAKAKRSYRKTFESNAMSNEIIIRGGEFSFVNVRQLHKNL